MKHEVIDGVDVFSFRQSDMFSHIQGYDLGWLVGLLEGEGSFMWKQMKSVSGSPLVYLIVQCGMTDSDTIERLDALTLRIGRVNIDKPNERSRTQLYRWRVQRKTPSIALMNLVYPHLSARRRSQIDDCLTMVTPPMTNRNGELDLAVSA